MLHCAPAVEPRYLSSVSPAVQTVVVSRLRQWLKQGLRQEAEILPMRRDRFPPQERLIGMVDPRRGRSRQNPRPSAQSAVFHRYPDTSGRNPRKKTGWRTNTRRAGHGSCNMAYDLGSVRRRGLCTSAGRGTHGFRGYWQKWLIRERLVAFRPAGFQSA